MNRKRAMSSKLAAPYRTNRRLYRAAASFGRFSLAKLERNFVQLSFMKTPTLSMNCIHSSLGRSALLSVLLACFALLPKAQAVNPPPDGGYPGGNTAEGQNALLSLSSGTYNTAVGLFSLLSNTTGSFNTALGAGTLLANTADENTATGAGALLSNTSGNGNTANGAFALFSNVDGVNNNAVGFFALLDNTSGDFNNALGHEALESNVDGAANNAFGDLALFSNVSGSGNTAIGDGALFGCTGSENVGVGQGAGGGITTGSNIIAIGAGVSGVSTIFGEVNDSCYIGNIYGAEISEFAAFVFVDADGKVGTGAVDANGNKVTLPGPQTMLNELHTQQTRIAELEATVTQQQRQIQSLFAGLQKVSDQLAAASPSRGGLEQSNPAPHTIASNH
jgi:uncharacterized coiled-coil protein SlyX